MRVGLPRRASFESLAPLRFGPPVTVTGPREAPNSVVHPPAEAATDVIGQDGQTANALPHWGTHTHCVLCVGMWLAEELGELRLEGLQSGDGL